MALPKISIITPSYNQGAFLEQTIQSVLDQGYPNLEYIIMDGGSKDQSVSIIKKYERYLAYWVSKPDKGQPNAINDGFRKVTGDIVAWINSDDLYGADTFKLVSDFFMNNNVSWLSGGCKLIDQEGLVTGQVPVSIPGSSFAWHNLLVRGFSIALAQPSTFWKRSVFENSGYLNERWQYSFDHEFFFRLFKIYGRPAVLEHTLSYFRIHDSSKTFVAEERFLKENKKIGLHHLSSASLKDQLYLSLVYIKECIK